MNILKTWLKRLLIWVGPFLVLLVFVLAGFFYWVLMTGHGTRWAVITAVHQLDGQVKGVSGSVWHGLTIASLQLTLPGIEVDLKQAHLKVNWRELQDRRLRIQDLSAGAIEVNLLSTPNHEDDTPFTMPELPVYIAVDRLAVGQLIIRQDGDDLPVSVSQATLALALNNAGGQVVVQSLKINHADAELTMNGDIKVLALAEPWPFDVNLELQVVATQTDSPLCARRYLPTLAVPGPDAGATLCRVDLNAHASGSMDLMTVSVKGGGQDMSLDADAQIALDQPFPVQTANVALRLPDGSSLHSQLQHEALTVDGVMQDRLYGWLRSQQLDVGQLVGAVIPPAVITAQADFDVQLVNLSDIQSAKLNLSIDKGSVWNKQALSGTLITALNPLPAPSSSPQSAAPAAWWQSIGLGQLDTDLVLGKNQIKTQGALGLKDSQLVLDISAPDLAAFWPDLPGGAVLKGQVAGSLHQHQVDLTTGYTPENSVAGEVGTAPIQAHLVLAGGWGPGATEQDALTGWRGRLQSLDVSHAGFAVLTTPSVPLSFLPDAVAPDWQWQLGTTDVAVSMDGKAILNLTHAASRGGASRWETRGQIKQVVVSPGLIDQIQKKLGQQSETKKEEGGVKLRNQPKVKDVEITLGADWNLVFDQGLQGKVHIRHLTGDVMVPSEPPVPLGLQTLELNVDIQRGNVGSSTVTAQLDVQTQKMGRVSATASTLVHTTAGGGVALDPKDLKTLKINADIDDLGWTSLFLDSAMELGGAVQANVQLQSRPDGSWKAGGVITGQKIKFLRIDDGVRLLDGELSARLDDDTLILERLYFPARLRAVPKEWRTAEWTSNNPEAQGGGLTITGQWNIFDSEGLVNVELYRYPILQRADRYAMVSGNIVLNAALPAITITGGITADAGWFDLDMLGGIATVDSDVVVIRAGDELKEASVPLDLAMDLEVDLGPRFYLTGYGLNSGLVGSLRLVMRNNKLTGIGALRTRGGAIEAYGQRLQLRKGTITFQGDITSPVLDIEALRTGLAVQSGVKVAGTARRPRIDLVSYPDVSDIEKLSWLLLGHGPDDSGGDIALLLSVGTSFLGTGEPFYRKFGIDEVSMRSGELGSAGSILPVESVVSGLDAGTSDIERRFIVVSKNVGKSITFSLRQALSDTGTVGHVSYQLMRNLTAELSVGTVNGLALVYRWFSRD